jgi:NAD(P)-dependent dehydrogenase (short-subunit alcohol dehydrogenase family)
MSRSSAIPALNGRTRDDVHVSASVITGAGSGIGRQVAVELAAHGHRLVLAGRRADALRETAELCDGETPVVVPTDVRDATAVDALFAAALDAHGRVDLLFNNAGATGPWGPLDELDPADWAAVIDVNLTGSFLCAQAAFKAMKAQDPQGGRIINNGSISAYAPRPGTVAYTASKHAISGLTRSVALEGRPHRIACGQIDIGNAASAMTEAMQRGVPQADGSVAAEPVMDVVEVGRAVAHMASLPLDANVLFMTIMATNMPFVGRG